MRLECVLVDECVWLFGCSIVGGSRRKVESFIYWKVFEVK